MLLLWENISYITWIFKPDFLPYWHADYYESFLILAACPLVLRLELTGPSAREIEGWQFFRVSLGLSHVLFSPPLFSRPKSNKVNTSLADGSISSRRNFVDTLFFIGSPVSRVQDQWINHCGINIKFTWRPIPKRCGSLQSSLSRSILK